MSYDTDNQYYHFKSAFTLFSYRFDGQKCSNFKSASDKRRPDFFVVFMCLEVLPFVVTT